VVAVLAMIPKEHGKPQPGLPQASPKRRLWVLLLKPWVQVSFVMSVLVLSYYLSRDDHLLATYIRITVNGAMQFLSGLSQALATLLALSLAFLVFEMESVRNEKNRAFETFRSQMYRLLE
jgi:hypothetical protein